MNPNETKRTFIAVKVSPDSRFLESLDRIKEELSGEDIRWVKPSNYHITLRFIGETSGETIGRISHALSTFINETDPFGFLITGLDVFRSISYPRVIYAGVNDWEALAGVKSDLDKILSGIIEVKNEKVFSPHLTLGRMKKCNDRDVLRQIVNEYRGHDFLRVENAKVIFYESILKKEGTDYVILNSFTS